MTCASNSALPAAFARFIDPVTFCELRREYRLPTPFLLQRCERIYTHYKSYLRPTSWEKATLVLCYQLNGKSEQGNAEQHFVYCKAYLNGRSHEVYTAVPTADLHSRLRPRHIPELDVIVWHFPADPALPQLTVLTDPQRVVQFLPYHGLPIAGPQALTQVEIDVVHYRPETRCTLRYVLHFNQHGRPQQCVVYGKTFADELGQEVARRMSYCWSWATQSPLRIARPLGYTAELRTVWQQGVDGQRLLAPTSAGRTTKSLALVARSVAALHQSSYPLPTVVTPGERLADAYKKARKMVNAFPEFAPLLELLLQQGADEYRTLPPTQVTLLHGDLHPRQFLIAGEHAVLFDFDEFTYGDAEQDLANFLVDLFIDCGELTHASHLADTFLQAYRSQVSWEVSPTRLTWHMRMQLLNKAYRLYLQQEPQLRERISTILEQAQAPWREPIHH